jgi:hypothetical protein
MADIAVSLMAVVAALSTYTVFFFVISDDPHRNSYLFCMIIINFKSYFVNRNYIYFAIFPRFLCNAQRTTSAKKAKTAPPQKGEVPLSELKKAISLF